MTIISSYSCGCRGCGKVIPAHTEIVMTSQGPFHIACAPAQDSSSEFELQFGGTLIASDLRLGVAYSFPGQDRRFSWSHFFIPASDLIKVSEAIRANWNKYEELKKVVAHGATVEKQGALGMTIRVSLVEPGVWLFKRHIGVCNSDQADKLSSEYQLALKKLQELSRVLKQ